MTKEQLIEARKRLNMNKQQLADRLDIDRRTLYNYEAGRHEIPVIVELAIQRLLSTEAKYKILPD